MAIEKLYFENEDANICYPLQYHLERAKEEGLKEIELFEAIPDNNNKDFIFCSLIGEVGDREFCKKSECKDYTSKSGRGICSNRGKLMNFGKQLKFKVN